MIKIECLYEKGLNMIIGAVMIGFALLFGIMSLTVLPIIGLIPAGLFLFGGAWFIAAPFEKACRISP